MDTAGAVAEAPSGLRIRNVTKRFGGISALNDVSFSVMPGALVGLIGPNGAGKSTAIDVISGVQRETSGDIEIDGRRINNMAAAQRRHIGVVRTFQIVKPLRGLSVLENVMVAAMFRDAKPQSVAKAKIIARQQLDYVGLSARTDYKASDLSLADRKMLEMARSLAAKPTVLLLDEVMGGLDPKAAAGMTKVVRDINSTGVTILVVEHVLKTLFQLVDRLIVLDQGNIIADGDVNSVLSDERVVRAYLGNRFKMDSSAER